jgi:phage repressor protein C with HTH and peptisase S24 domain
MLMLSSLKLRPMKETMGERARRRREAMKLTQEQVTAQVPGMSASALSQFENGISKGLRPENLVDLARVLGMTAEELVEGDGDENVHDRRPKTAAMKRRGSIAMRDVPIVGFAVATPEEDGFFDDMGFPTGAGEAYIPWPTSDPDAYAVRVKNDSMSPRIRAGEVIVVSPRTTPSPGDDVLVRLRNGRKMVKELLYQRGGAVTFGSINQAYKPVTVSLEEIESIQFIEGRARGAMTKE